MNVGNSHHFGGEGGRKGNSTFKEVPSCSWNKKVWRLKM